MKQSRIKAEKRPARRANISKNIRKSLTEMDSDELFEKYGKSVAGGERKKKPKMRVSGKSVFKIRDIIKKGTKK